MPSPYPEADLYARGWEDGYAAATADLQQMVDDRIRSMHNRRMVTQLIRIVRNRALDPKVPTP